MMRSVGNDTSVSKIGVSSKTFQEGQVDLGLQNQNRPFLCNQGDGDDDNDDDGDGKGGPTWKVYSSCCSMSMISDTDIYDVAAATSACASAYSPSSCFKGLQPFYVSCPPSLPLFQSSGEMATAAMGFPFTAAQWKELERQAMIYKYMVASVPVPLDLLYSSFPTNLSPPTTFASPSPSYLLGKYVNGVNLSWSGNNKDAEPWRCRRTDGKKWRCSRDVAPNHKYCDRHMNRGRPRSRKHVELVHQNRDSQSEFPTTNNTKSKNNSNPSKKIRFDDPSPQPVGSSLPSVQFSKTPTFDHPMSSGAKPSQDSRSLAWNEEQQWQWLVPENMKSIAFENDLEGVPLNLNSEAGFSSKSDMGLLERPLIDAWSMGMAGTKDSGGNNKSFLVPSKGSHGNAIDEDRCQIHMGLGLIDSWVASSTSPGGPLAEVLRPGPLTMTSNQGALETGGSDFVTPPATTVSSPSGVLQKPFGTFSDRSGSNSPTCQYSKANSEMPYHWLN